MKDLDHLKQLVYEYEVDPKHTITEEHIRVRRECVLKYGDKTVKRKIRQVYRRLLEERRCYFEQV